MRDREREELVEIVETEVVDEEETDWGRLRWGDMGMACVLSGS